jgi:steroid delta-isomerase-like uncharacterized protein
VATRLGDAERDPTSVRRAGGRLSLRARALLPVDIVRRRSPPGAHHDATRGDGGVVPRLSNSSVFGFGLKKSLCAGPVVLLNKEGPMSDENKRVARRIFDEHYNRRNAVIASEVFAPDVSLQTPDGVFAGLEGAVALLQAYATAFPDFRLTIDDLVAEGDRVVVRYAFTGTHRGPLADIPATGKQVSVTNGVAFYRITGGKVTHGDLAWDKYGLLQQIGVLAVGKPAGT